MSIHTILQNGFLELYEQKITDPQLAIKWLGNYILQTNPNTPHIIEQPKNLVSLILEKKKGGSKIE